MAEKAKAKFRDDPVATVRRHLLCDGEGCDGEMIGTGHGFSGMETSWKHQCNKCGKEAWASNHYPCYAHIPR